MALAIAVALLLASMSRQASAQPGLSHCSTTGQNLTVQDVLETHYLWYQFVPRVDAAQYDSPEAYLDAVRYRPLDSTFSYITSRAANDAFFGDSQFVGVGFLFRTDATELRVQQVFDGSPAQEAGLARGHHIVEINGRSVASLVAANSLDAALGTETIGAEVEIVFDSANGTRRRARMVKRIVTIPTVSSTRVLDVAGRRVGYFNFRNFVQPSYAALDAAFGAFRSAGVNELVLDLRYNGGGLVDVAVHLASLIGGAVTNGNVFAEVRHNARDTARNETLRFTSATPALGLPRVFVITTRASASASELVINALRPFVHVVTIGDRTYGKPVGQYGLPFCDKVLAPVAFAMVNAQGVGNYFDGIPAECAAADDVDHELGDAAESSLETALGYIRTGSCARSSASAAQASVTASSDRSLSAPLLIGWRAVVNAY